MLTKSRAITLIGMSGTGKTELAWKLEKWGWHHFNCDYLIGTKYLKDEVADTVGDGVKKDNLAPLSRYIGQVGKGGLKLEEFKRRQARYIEAERAALYDMRDAVKAQGAKLVNDSTGSLCEIEDEALFARLAEDSLFVYIKAGPEQEEELLKRALADPKPLYFPPKPFDEWLAQYLKEKNLKSVEEIAPNDFSKWVFPKLFRSRIPKYERLAARYGITVSSDAVWNVKSEEEFLKLVEDVQNS
jgi:dephospho-CoA kinase